jgi:pyruvate formate lyase activating enzyme
MMARCEVCFRHCEIREGDTGFCGARSCREGRVTASNYGKITSLALDPIEKKPLRRFYPGSLILSAGSYGCNLRCPFCQNHEITWSERAWRFADEAEYLPPEELVEIARSYQNRGNIGIAFTYNEPLVGFEYVRDASRLAHNAGLKTVLVTNGCAQLSVLEELAPGIDAMNIDLKGFTDHYYNDVLKGSRQMVMDFIARAVQVCHVELTCLIVPGENDSEEEMRRMAGWIASLQDDRGRQTGREITLHITRFFPRFHMLDREATDVRVVSHLVRVAQEQLRYVYRGNC